MSISISDKLSMLWSRVVVVVSGEFRVGGGVTRGRGSAGETGGSLTSLGSRLSGILSK